MAALEDDLSPLLDDYIDNDLPTNRLNRSSVETGPTGGGESKLPPVDWLSKLSGKYPTEVLFDDFPPLQPAPSGMSQHAAPPRMLPTVGSRLTSGLRRGLLLTVLSGLAVAVLLAGGYALASTSWLSSLFEQAPPAAREQ